MTTDIDELHNSGQPNLQDFLNRALRDTAFPASRRAGARTAVAAFGRLMQRSPDELPAHQGFIIQQMRRLRRKPTGLSPKTLSNTRSELLYLVRSVRGRGPRSALPLSPEWGRFRIGLKDGPAWWSLSRLAGFSSRQHLAPSAVDDAHIQRFCEALQGSGEVADPVGHTRRVVRVWNRLAADDPALRIAPLTLTPQQRNRWTLQQSEFAPSFREDVEAWFHRLTSDDPFSSRPCRALRPSTIRTRRHQLFKAASALVSPVTPSRPFAPWRIS